MSDTANTPRCPECHCYGSGVHLANCSQVIGSSSNERYMDPLRWDAPGRILYSVKIETDWRKECRDAWVQFASAFSHKADPSEWDFTIVGIFADSLLEEFVKRFKPEGIE